MFNKEQPADGWNWNMCQVFKINEWCTLFFDIYFFGALVCLTVVYLYPF